MDSQKTGFDQEDLRAATKVLVALSHPDKKGLIGHWHFYSLT